jgi:hypothetical protein
LPSLFETVRRLPTSATAFRRASNQTRNSSILAGTEASTSFLFFVASRPLPCGSGETWRAALRPAAATPVPVPPACAGLPDRDAASVTPPPRLAPRSVVRIDVHGSKDRVKDASPDVGYNFLCLRGCIRLVAYADDVPLLGVLRTSAVIGAFPPREDPRDSERTDLGPRSDDAPRRAPPSRRPGCLQPSRHAKEFRRGEIAPSGLRAGSLAHAAHTFSPDWGECL